MIYVVRLKDKYIKEIAPELKKEYNYKSIMEVPKLSKIVINQGCGRAIADKKILQHSSEEITRIAGQKSVVTKAKKSIAAFKLRTGMPIGVKVTLRGDRMYEFLDRLIAVVLPRVRDFKGVNPKGFDRGGSYNLGLTEQVIFPEVDIDKVYKIKGMNITFVMNKKDIKANHSLLSKFGMPFKK